MNKTLRLMIKEPDKPVEERTYEISFKDEEERAAEELKLAQQLVDGYVEVSAIGGDVIALINEDGMSQGLKHNCGFVGNIVFVHEIVEDDEVWWGSLTDDEIRKIKIWAKVNENEVHPGVGIQIFTGEQADEYREKLREVARRREAQWYSF